MPAVNTNTVRSYQTKKWCAGADYFLLNHKNICFLCNVSSKWVLEPIMDVAHVLVRLFATHRCVVGLDFRAVLLCDKCSHRARCVLVGQYQWEFIIWDTCSVSFVHLHSSVSVFVLVLTVQSNASCDFDTLHNALLQAKSSIKTCLCTLP